MPGQHILLLCQAHSGREEKAGTARAARYVPPCLQEQLPGRLPDARSPWQASACTSYPQRSPSCDRAIAHSLTHCAVRKCRSHLPVLGGLHLPSHSVHVFEHLQQLLLGGLHLSAWRVIDPVRLEGGHVERDALVFVHSLLGLGRQAAAEEAMPQGQHGRDAASSGHRHRPQHPCCIVPPPRCTAHNSQPAAAPRSPPPPRSDIPCLPHGAPCQLGPGGGGAAMAALEGAVRGAEGVLRHTALPRRFPPAPCRPSTRR